MAIALVAATTRTSSWLAAAASPRGQSPTATVTVGNKLLVWAFFSASPGTVTMSDNSSQSGTANTYTQVGANVAGTSIFAALFYCDVTRSILSTDTISVAWTGGSIGSQIDISEWSGVATGAAASNVSNTGSSSTPSTSALTAATVGDLVLGGFGIASAQTFTVGLDGQGNTMTSLHSPTAANSRSSGVEYLIESTTSAFNPAATWGGSGTWAALGARFNAASGVPTGGAVAVTGTQTVGSVLTATNSGWSGGPTSYSITWQRADDAAFTTGVTTVRGPTTPGGGGTSDTYTLSSTDDTKYIRAQATATNGSGTSSSVNSTATGQITYPVATGGAVALSGTQNVGSTLTATTSGWTGQVDSYTFTWQHANDAGFTVSVTTIQGPTSTAGTTDTYLLGSGDDGKYVRCQAVAVNDGGSSTPASSAPTSLVTYPGPSNTVAPVASGSATVGGTVTVTTGTWNPGP